MSYDDKPKKPRKRCACGARNWIYSPPSGCEYEGYECGDCGDFISMDDRELCVMGGDDGPSDADPGL